MKVTELIALLERYVDDDPEVCVSQTMKTVEFHDTDVVYTTLGDASTTDASITGDGRWLRLDVW